MERVVIIGCGITGRFISRLLMERGYQVTVIDDRRGGTWKFSGVAGIGFLPNKSIGGQFDVNITDFIEKTSEFFPLHIYNSDPPDKVENYLRQLLTEKRVENLFHPLSGKTLPFLTMEGSIRPGITSWRTIFPFPESGVVTLVLPACITGISGDRVRIRLKDLIAQFNWNVRVNVVEEDIFCRSGYFSLLEVNRLFDTRPELVQMFIEKLKNYGEGTIFVPPILGIERWKENFEIVGEETGLNVSEMSAVEESPFGLRWEMECDGILEPVIKLKGRVVKYKFSEDRIEGVVTESGTFIEGDRFVLTTGKFFSGGIIRDSSKTVESLFSLPVFIGDRLLIGEEDIQNYFGNDFWDIHPIWFAGVKRDSVGRPVNEYGEIIFSNLYAAGGVVAGVDYINSGAGISASLYSIKGVDFVNE